MPRKPSPAARFGTRFHAWVESRFGQPELIPYDELEGRADAGIDDESELAELVARFESGPYADRVPHAVEAPFALVLAGQVVRGRIDAVYAEDVDGERGFVVVDWKTNTDGDGRPAAARDLPARLGRADRHPARPGAGGVPLRPLGADGRARQPAGPRRAGAHRQRVTRRLSHPRPALVMASTDPAARAGGATRRMGT